MGLGIWYVTEKLKEYIKPFVSKYLEEIQNDLMNMSTTRKELEPLISKMKEFESGPEAQKVLEMNNTIEEKIQNVKEMLEPYKERYSWLSLDNITKFFDYLFLDNLKTIKTFVMNNTAVKQYIESEMKDNTVNHMEPLQALMKENLKDVISAIGFIFITAIIKIANPDAGSQLETTLDEMLDKY